MCRSARAIRFLPSRSRLLSFVTFLTGLLALAAPAQATFARAGRRLAASVEALRRAGLHARGEIGEADPNVALADALRASPADEVIIPTDPSEQAGPLEDEVIERARRELHKPITQIVVEPRQGMSAGVREVRELPPYASDGERLASSLDTEILRCPITGSPLARAAGGLLTSSEGRRYGVVGDVPILLDAESTPFDPPLAADAPPASRRLRAILDRLVPSPTRAVGSSRRFDRLADLVAARDRRARVLVIGGGETGQGMDGFIKRPELELIETDVYIGPRTQVVCDAHQLPFSDRCFDGVIAQAVLEHVADPQRVVAEIHRVLKRDGLVYSETPFMQQVHEGAFDFTRFTMVGHRRLFRWFDELDAGVVCGPATALIWGLRYFVRSLPRRSRVVRELLDRAVCLCFFWLKYLDDVLVSRPGAVDAASGTYFLGQRRDSPISDREVLASSYRGGFRQRPLR
jgi:SAM-dependent methyltransferase